MDRRKFISDSVLAAAAVSLQGCVASSGTAGTAKRRRPGIPELTQTVQAPSGDIRALYIMLGHNMWCDWPTVRMGDDLEKASLMLPEIRRPDLYLKCRDDIWRAVTDHAAAKGLNLLVVDLGEGLFYPSHPELSVEGTWSVEKMQDEIRRLNSIGLEVVPKLNFSTTHNGWMKDYRHMISSEPYYRMCEDVIGDVVRIFGNPRFFHIGYDEQYGGFDPATNTTSDHKRLVEFEALDKAGFDQVPCGTNWSGIVRRRLNTGADDVIGKLVDYGRRTIPKERLMGFMMAPWVRCETQEHLEFQLRGIDLFSEALGSPDCR